VAELVTNKRLGTTFGLLAVGAVLWAILKGKTQEGTGETKTFPYVPYSVPKGTPLPEGAPDYREMARQAAIDNQVPPALFVRLIDRESHFQPDVVGVTGDIGIAQLNPRFHPRGVAQDPAQALPYAAKYLRRMYDRFGTWEEAVAAYNWGPTNLAVHGINGIPSSVRSYVDAIVKS